MIKLIVLTWKIMENTENYVDSFIFSLENMPEEYSDNGQNCCVQVVLLETDSA